MTKYFIGRDSEGIFAIYRATFDGTTLLSEQQWSIPKGTGWEKTNRVRQWYFAGNDKIWESTQGEVESYLPSGATSS